MRISGAARLEMDLDGRLTEFLAVPLEHDPDGIDQRGTEPDFDSLFAAAGLDPATFREAEPEWNPLVDCDVRRAWVGTYPDRPDHEMRIEAGGYGGVPVYFQVVPPWREAGRQTTQEISATDRAVLYFLLTLLVILVVGALFFVRRNLRLGRGDLRGATLTALLVFGLMLVAWVLGAHHVAGFQEIGVFFLTAVQSGLLVGSLVWIVYLALEPYVRRIWPHALISWSRFLEGRFRDPLLGRDLVVGGAAGAMVAVFVVAGALVGALTGGAPDPLLADPASFEGTRHALSNVFSQFPGATATPIGLFFFLVLLKGLFRKTAIAVGTIFVLMATLLFLGSSGGVWGALFSIAVWSLILAVTIRIGLLAAVFSFYFANVLLTFPLTPDPGLWFAPQVYLVLAVLIGMVGWGFYLVTAGRPLFAFDPLPDGA